MRATTCTQLMHYVLNSYFEVWLYGVPDLLLLNPDQVEWAYYMQWPRPWFFMGRIMPLLRVLGFWRGHPAEVYLAWSWYWRFWDPIAFDGEIIPKEERRLAVRRAIRWLFAGRERL